MIARMPLTRWQALNHVTADDIHMHCSRMGHFELPTKDFEIADVVEKMAVHCIESVKFRHSFLDLSTFLWIDRPMKMYLMIYWRHNSVESNVTKQFLDREFVNKNQSYCEKCGHINRADGLVKQILSGKMFGTKSRGRERTKYTNSLNNFITRKESPDNGELTTERIGWPWPLMSVTDLAHDDDDDDGDDDEDDDCDE